MKASSVSRLEMPYGMIIQNTGGELELEGHKTLTPLGFTGVGHLGVGGRQGQEFCRRLQIL